MIARFFIERPVLANVIAILMIVLGAVAVFSLPVSQYPNITPPTIQVTARYPGANAATLIREVGTPIEQKVNGVEGMIYMQSTNTSDGTYSLSVTFNIGTDPDQAQILVQNRVSSALASLPETVQAQGVQTAKRSTAILTMTALTSEDPTHDGLFLSNYATLNLVDELARVPGVGGVTVFGATQYAMRVWLDPNKMAARGLQPSDISNAINRQSRSVGTGQLGAPPMTSNGAFQYILDIDSKLSSAEQFGDIIVKSNGSATTRLKDVSRVELGAQQYSQAFTVNGNVGVGLAISQLPEANALEVATLVSKRMEELSKRFPPGMSYSVPFDTTRFVTSAIGDVYATLIEAGVLVLLVILVFLQDWRAVLIPATTVPVTIIGTFAAMAAIGYSVNLSTLFALVLAIGIVVDDAIIIVEGVAHNMTGGRSAKDASIAAMKTLTGPIIGITLVLMAVFIPAALLPGLSGELYRQFAIVIAATALISAVNALTLKPTQAALWLKPTKRPEQRNFLARGFNAGYARVEAGYGSVLRLLLKAPIVCGLVTLALVATAFIALSRTPSAFLPPEDQGYMMVSVQLPEGASLARTQKTMSIVTERIRSMSAVTDVVAVSGVSALNGNASLSNGGLAFVILKDWDDRGENETLQPVFMALMQTLQGLPDGTATVFPPPPIQGVGNVSGFTMQLLLTNGSGDYAVLEKAATDLGNKAMETGMLRQISQPFRTNAPRFAISIDRTKAELMNLDVGAAYDALGAYTGGNYVGQFSEFGRNYQIYIQADVAFRRTPDNVGDIKVTNRDGKMIPLSSMADIRDSSGPALVGTYNLYPSTSLSGVPAPGFSTGQTIAMMEQLAASELPQGMDYSWTAVSYQEKLVGNQIYLVYGLGLLLIYLVLAGQYGSWFAPITVIGSVPLALLGTSLTLVALNISNNLYTQIGLVLLIALAAKNAILIVEYARELRLLEGRSITQAAYEAGLLRLRPIVMTSITFILGVVPLVTASGAGANAQRSIGIAVFTGMIGSTLLAPFLVPPLFVLMQRLEERWFSKNLESVGSAD